MVRGSAVHCPVAAMVGGSAVAASETCTDIIIGHAQVAIY
jgi:hypothetical protein